MAGIDFPGYTSNTVARIAHVRLPDEMRTPEGGIDVPGVGPLPFGHNRLDRGGLIYAAFERDRPMVGTIEFDQHADDSEPMTLDELRDSARRVLGVDLPVEPPHRRRATCVAPHRRAEHPTGRPLPRGKHLPASAIPRMCIPRWADRA